MQNQFPEMCFSTLPSTGKLICIKRGESGYYLSDWDTGDENKNRELADYQNRKLGVTHAMEQAFIIGSMLRWTVPGANPQTYLDQAAYQCGQQINGHIKHDAMSLYYPFSGMLYEFKVAEKPQLYLRLEALPPEMLGTHSDVTILPDLVCGKPYVQVEAKQTDNDPFMLTILPHCLSHEQKEINAGYAISMRMQVGAQEIVMGERYTSPAQFVTWRRTPENDKGGPHNFYWGHYLNKREDAISDFCERIHSEYQRLTQRNARQPQSHTRKEPER